MMRRATLPIGAAVVALVLAVGASAAEAFDAHGSVEQVYVTGLSPGARVTLVDGAGATVATKTGDAQRGLLFREVKPSSGYRFRATGADESSGPLTVLSHRTVPPSTYLYK